MYESNLVYAEVLSTLTPTLYRCNGLLSVLDVSYDDETCKKILSKSLLLFVYVNVLVLGN